MWALSAVGGIAISFALSGVHDQGAHVRLTLSPDGVRFAISGDLADWRLEVVTEQGQPVFDSAVRSERELDWGLTDPQGQPVETGVYTYTLTIHLRDTATPRQQRGQWLVE